ncbi:MAG: hypothetical protein PHS93_06300 [Candidatus Omnitrophica bacterium]|nr:hypothetical protein [Candidatus Omnitrophota bacterium]MDD5352759.1 hypothetical protein [Candidatus Omnitrophota bacterium]MDD5550358.1 hypothetical protein [Candidatus Omnitrophota bacterium]
MEDNRKFLRYVIPAFIYFIEVISFLVLFSLFDSNVLNSFKIFLGYISKKNMLSIILTGFILSGGLGAFFCNIYHFFYSFKVLDLRKLVFDAVDKSYLKVIMNRKNLTAGEIYTGDRRISLMIDTVLWSQRRLINKKILGAEERTQTYHDHMHSLGAIIIATFFACISWLVIVSVSGCSCELAIFGHGTLWLNCGYWLFIIFWILLINGFLFAYSRLRWQLVFHRYSILLDVLKDDFGWNNKTPAEIEINSIVSA